MLNYQSQILVLLISPVYTVHYFRKYFLLFDIAISDVNTMIITISITNLITSELIALVKILFSRQNTTAGTLRFLGGSGLMPKKWKCGKRT